MTDKEQDAAQPDPTRFKDSRWPARPLDRDNLPPEFTVDSLKHMPARDLIWLEKEADLTPTQRETFVAASKELFPGISQVGESVRAFSQVSQSKWQTRLFGPPRDPIGEDIQKTVKELSTRPNLIPTDHAKKRHEEQQENLRQLYEATENMRLLLFQLVQRTEQQHQAAERQKTTNWLLAGIAAASMVGTFATVQGSERMWFTLIAAVILLGVLYVVMHGGGSSSDK